MRGRPNILFITSDQQRGDCYGFEGRKVKTPHLDRMARAGGLAPDGCDTTRDPNNPCFVRPTGDELYRRFSRVSDDIVAVAERVWYATVKEA